MRGGGGGEGGTRDEGTQPLLLPLLCSYPLCSYTTSWPNQGRRWHSTGYPRVESHSAVISHPRHPWTTRGLYAQLIYLFGLFSSSYASYLLPRYFMYIVSRIVLKHQIISPLSSRLKISLELRSASFRFLVDSLYHFVSVLCFSFIGWYLYIGGCCSKARH